MTSNTSSESLNTEETLADNNVALRRPMSSGIIGLTKDITYTPNAANVSPLAPNNLVFATTGISNGYQSSLDTSGITNFTAYNDYIHNEGFRRKNVMGTLVLASQRFEVYSRQFR